MPTIFISYSREDEVWLKQLLKFLSGGLFQEPPRPNCFNFLRSVPRLMPSMPAARL